MPTTEGPLPADERSDDALLAAARGGDRHALRVLVGRHVDWLRAVVRRRLPPTLRREVDSGDLMHEVVLGVLGGAGLRGVEDLDHFRALLARAAERDVLDRMRWTARARRTRGRERPVHGDSSWTRHAPHDTSTRPSQHALRGERVAWIRLAMARLGQADREVLELRVWQSLGYEEIGRRLGMAPDAARMRVQRALKRLAQAVEALRG